MRFADPWFLLLLLILPVLAWSYFRSGSRLSGRVRYSDISLLRGLEPSLRLRLRHLPFLLYMAALTLLVIALARPRSSSREQKVDTEGIDIVLAMDVSSSMLAEDFKPKNRLEAAKKVAAEFLAGRTNDRIGLVVFAGESFTQCPLTLDYGVILTLLESQAVAEEDWDGTAIGMGLANAVNRLRESEAKSKVIILLTDGVNNRGQIDPVTAARIAQSFDIKIYTIGAGTRGTAMYPVNDPMFGKRYVRMPVEIDEISLNKIAEITGGKYFRATDTQSLAAIYREIGEMEKTKIEVSEYTRYTELYVRFAGVALVLLLSGWFLSQTWLRRLP